MNRTLWKMQGISEKLWSTSSAIAREAAVAGQSGRGFAIVAEEARNISLAMRDYLEKTLFGEEDESNDFLADKANALQYLALNTAIEAANMGYPGRAMAVYAEEVRTLSMETEALLTHVTRTEFPQPMVKQPLRSVMDRVCLMQFFANGLRFVEDIRCVDEVIWGDVKTDNGILFLRGREIPLIDIFKAQEETSYIITGTPWGGNRPHRYAYAIAVNTMDVSAIFNSAIGCPVAPAEDFRYRDFVRECWDAEEGQLYFMDWPALHEHITKE